MLMYIFANGNIPFYIEVIKDQISYQEYFCFNNSALYITKQKTNKFFDVILNNNLLSLNLTMTKQVMENRQLVFENVKSIRERINQDLDP